jgi:dynein heavy chain
VRGRLELNVTNLDQLNSTLQLLEELGDMENKIDDIYLPIENLYAKLRYGVELLAALAAVLSPF